MTIDLSQFQHVEPDGVRVLRDCHLPDDMSPMLLRQGDEEYLCVSASDWDRILSTGISALAGKEVIRINLEEARPRFMILAPDELAVFPQKAGG